MRLADLAKRPDFCLGPLLISPSRRLAEGPAGSATMEPIVLQVLLLLADARGTVVTRQELFDKVWGGAMVGDDSLNRAVAAVRRVANDTAPGLLTIETIPRTGYRMVGELAGYQESLPAGSSGMRMSRRTLVGTGVAATAVVGAGGASLWWMADGERQKFESLMARGEAALDYRDHTISPHEHFRQAVSIRPKDARALGLLAYSEALNVEVSTEGTGTALQKADQAVRAALARDASEPNALLAQTMLQRATLDLAANEDRLRAILAADPRNIFAMRHLWDLLQSAGRSRDAFALIERAIALKPLAAGNNFPRAQLLWILGRNGEADRVINRAMHYWPSHRWVRFARFIIFAFTGREQAALGMLDDRDTATQFFSSESIALWQISLAAIENPSPSNVAAAIDANMKVAKQKPQLSRQAVMTFSQLGEIDAAYEIANTQLLFQAPSDGSASPRGKSTAWIFAPWLFTPPLARFRADPRFTTLCDGIGLSDYWAKRGLRPDYPIGTD